MKGKEAEPALASISDLEHPRFTSHRYLSLERFMSPTNPISFWDDGNVGKLGPLHQVPFTDYILLIKLLLSLSPPNPIPFKKFPKMAETIDSLRIRWDCRWVWGRVPNQLKYALSSNELRITISIVFYHRLATAAMLELRLCLGSKF